jgi:mevalonate kinase
LVEKIGEIASLEEVSKVDEKFKGAVKSSVVVFIYFYVLMVYAFKCTLKSCSVEIESELPLGAGLGSSASYCTALVGALSRFLKTDNALSSDELNKWSFQGEKLLHGTPSGVDNTVSVFGGAIVYQKDIAKGTSSMRPIQMNVRIRILVVNTKVPRNTKTLVAGVRSLLEANPDEIRAKFAEIDRIAAQFENLVAGEDDSLLKIGELFKRNQVLLHELGVGHARISEALEVLEILAIPGKLTGAGGGGCLFGLLSALGEHDSESVIKEAIEKLENNGFEVFEAEIGCKGVHIKESR